MNDFCIISISDTREHYKENIRNQVVGTEHLVPCINGNAVDLRYELSIRGMRVVYPGMFSNGEIGVWLSQFNAWAYALTKNIHLAVFEDDAVPTDRFTEMFLKYQVELPPDYDFCALWVPDDQRGDYLYDVEYNDEGMPMKADENRHPDHSIYNFGSDILARAYQGYGLVATLFSPKGAERLLQIAREEGIYTPADCFIYQEAHKGKLDAYAPKPDFATAVTYDWKAPTTVHTEGRDI